MASKININLDTSKENYLVAKCKQNDDLTLEASIFENGLALDLTNKTITIQALKSDNTYIIQNTDIVKENNKINAELDRDFSRVPGTTKIEIVLVESSKQNTTFSFYLEVVGSVIRGAVQSSNTATILEALDNKIIEAGQVKQETEELVQSGGAATKGEVQEINASLEQIKNTETIITGIKILTEDINFDNSPVIQAFIDKLNENETLTLPKGKYNCKSAIDMSKLPKGSKINFQGELIFNNDTDGIIVNSVDSEIFIQSIKSKYSSYKTIPQNLNIIGVKAISIVKSNIIIKNIVGFTHGLDIVGDGATTNNAPNYRYKGTIYSDFKVEYIDSKVGVYVDKNYGYVNENVFYIKWLDCYDGLFFNENGTWFDPFNNNKIIYIGLENIEHDGITLNNCRNNLIQAVRFENVGNKAIIEDNRSSGNVFINNYPIQSSKLDLNGLRRVWLGNQGASDYEPVVQLQFTNWSGSPVNINRGFHSELPNNTIYFDYNDATKTTFSDIFCKVKKSDGSTGLVYFDDYTSDGTLGISNTNATLSRKIKIVRASSSSSPVELTTSPEMQQKGYNFYLVVKYKTKPIIIKKSNGSVSVSDIPSTGTYQAMYIEDNWKLLKISDDYDSWYF